MQGSELIRPATENVDINSRVRSNTVDKGYALDIAVSLDSRCDPSGCLGAGTAALIRHRSPVR